MTRWWALCKREWLEHRGGFAWAPLTVLVLMFGAALLAISIGSWSSSESDASFVDLIERAAAHPEASALGLQMMLRRIAGPFVWLYFGVGLFVMLGSLYDERRDRTILFWKSLPVSDTETVLSKLANVIVLAPLATVGVITLAHVLFLAFISVIAAGSEQVSITALWGQAQLPHSILEWLFGFATQNLWTLPIWCWLLLVSALAPRLPILWAVVVPLLPIVLERALFGSWGLLATIRRHLDVVALPAFRDPQDAGVMQVIGLPEMRALWGTAEFWLGILVGIALLSATIYFRRRNNEL